MKQAIPDYSTVPTGLPMIHYRYTKYGMIDTKVNLGFYTTNHDFGKGQIIT